MLAIALPFGVVLGARLQSSLANQPPIALGSGEIDPEWWLEFRARATGLEATFTPTVIGFAVPLDNLSAVLDATPRPLMLAVPITVSVLAWAFLWGGLVDRFDRGRPTGLRGFCAAGLRHAPRFALISLCAAAVQVALYATLHRGLFGPVFSALASIAPSERSAFAYRVVLYLVFGSVITIVSLVADFARIGLVSSGLRTVQASLVSAARLLRAHPLEVALLYVTVAMLFVLLLAGYGTLETIGGVRVGGWRGVLVAQAYITARIALRLVLVGAQVGLVRRVGPRASPAMAPPRGGAIGG